MTSSTEDPALDVPEADVATAVALITANAVILDVRESDEWRAGHAPQAVHIPLDTLAATPLSQFQGKRVVVVCRSGRRSALATAALRRSGVNAVNLIGGMQAWRDQGQQLVAESGSTPAVI